MQNIKESFIHARNIEQMLLDNLFGESKKRKGFIHLACQLVVARTLTIWQSFTL